MSIAKTIPGQVAQEIDTWRERDLQIQGGGLKSLDDLTVQRWRREIHDCLAQVNALAERGRKAAEDDVTSRTSSVRTICTHFATAANCECRGTNLTNLVRAHRKLFQEGFGGR